MTRISLEYDHMSFDDFDEFLADKPKNERWELVGGRVVKMMVGARWEHNYIVQNLSTALRERLRAAGSTCRTLTETFFVKERALDAALLPDVIVHCGTLEPGATSLNDPVVLAEILSAGTEARDRILKWQVYQQLPSLQHYVVVSRDRPHIEVMNRVGANWSGLQVLDALESMLALPAIGLEVPLAEIYRDVLG